MSNEDVEIAALMRRERERQSRKLVLIASENYTSQAVLEAQGSVLTNKYAEGYPGRRYYGGCEEIDEVERVAIERAQRLFSAEYANVQPHSGTQANVAAYLALLEYGDTVMSMKQSDGGHLSHGSPVNFSGKWYRFVHYGVDRETELLDYEQISRLARETRPKLIVAGASSYPRVIDFEKLHYIAEEVGASLMVDMAHLAGLVAAGVHPSPVPWAQVVTSTTHKTLRGPRGGFLLGKSAIGKALDAAIFPGVQGGPLMHVIAAKAIAFHEAMQPEFVRYQERVVENCRTLASELARLGFRLVAGGTDNHLLLIDLRPMGITGKQAEEALDEVGISTNRNSIPFDTLPPHFAGGLRLGTPAVTTRGMGSEEMRRIAALVHKMLTGLEDERVRREVSEEVGELSRRFPLY